MQTKDITSFQQLGSYVLSALYSKCAKSTHWKLHWSQNHKLKIAQGVDFVCPIALTTATLLDFLDQFRQACVMCVCVRARVYVCVRGVFRGRKPKLVVAWIPIAILLNVSLKCRGL